MVTRQVNPGSHGVDAGAEQRLRDLNIVLPSPPTPLGAYVETVQTGNLLFLSGMLPIVDGVPKFFGRVGAELDLEQGRAAAYAACLNALATVKAALGSLDKVTRVVRLGVSIATSPDFVEHPKLADAASELLESVFGRDKTSTRLITGVVNLPLGLPVALEIIFETAP
jgi:enamine deaminase RidA (YjgF/YER057c/UK114 family)